jgi:hypothetical protein
MSRVCSTFFLFVFTMTMVMKAWFRMLASAFKSPAPAQTVAGLSVLAFSLYTGAPSHLLSGYGSCLPDRRVLQYVACCF